MFGCTLYIHNTKKACFVRLRGCPYAPIHLDAPICMDGPVCLDAPICLPVCLDTLICLDTPCMLGHCYMFRCHPYVWMMFDTPCTYTTQRKDALSYWGGVHILPYIWMPPVHIQHKESMLCQTKGVSIYSHTFGCPLCVWMPPVCLDATICLDAPYVWMAFCMFGCLICLDTPVCLDAPCMFGHPPCLYSHMFGCPLYVCLPPCLDTPLYGWMPPHIWLCPVCLDAAKCMEASTGMRGIQTYRECPNIQGHPNVWGAYGHPLSLTKHAFFVLHMYSRHLNIFQTYMGIQTYGEHPNIQEGVKTWEASKHTGSYPNIWGHPNIQEGVQTYGGIQTYRGHPNIWGHPNIQGMHPNIWGHPNILGMSKHGGHPNIQVGIQTWGIQI